MFNAKSDENNIIADIQERKLIWEYICIRNLFSNDRLIIEEETNNNLSRSPITKEEIERTVYILKNNKVTGSDEVPPELLKLINKRGMAVLHKLFNKIYNTGIYPIQWFTSAFMPLPKRNNAKKCEDRLI